MSFMTAKKRYSWRAVHRNEGKTNSTGGATVAVEEMLSRAKSALAKFEKVDGLVHISEAVVLDRQALDLCPPGHQMRWRSLTLLALHLRHRFQQLAVIEDIEESTECSREALELCPEDHPDRSTSLKNLALHLSDSYKLLGEIADLHEVIVVEKQVLDLRPEGHSDRSTSLNNVAGYLFDRYSRLGDMTDLSEAIVLGRQALDLRPEGHTERLSSLNNVALYLYFRYRRHGDVTDLDEAIILGRQALDLCSSGHPLHVTSLTNVALYFYDRYEQLGDMTNLNEAIILSRQALDLFSPRHPDRPISLNNLANYLSNRYDQLGEMTDLNEAIILGRQALDLCPSEHPLHLTSLGNVALYLNNRYQRLGDMKDLDRAIILGRQALNLCPPGHPCRPWSLHRLTGYLYVRFTQSWESEDYYDLFSLYTHLSTISQTLSSVDLSTATQWITEAEGFHDPTILLAYETYFRLFVQHLVALPSLPNHLQTFKDLASSLTVDAFSACLRYQHPKKAVELLEQGRDVLWNQIARLRSPLRDVIASGQEGQALADEFTRLSSEIDNAMHSQSSDRYDRLCSLTVDLQFATTKIRKLPGLARFLLPSPFSELQRAASGGPVVVVNASQYSCDALVVFFDRDPAHIPLQITKSRVQGLSRQLQSLTLNAKSMDNGRDLTRFLRILWDEVVSPIAAFLQMTVPPGSRIWWCPTSQFCLLPLHAAGPYRDCQRNFCDLYISSYTSTLTALIHARRNDLSATTSIQEKRFLAVGQANAQSRSGFLSVDSGIAIVAQRIQGLATFIRLDGPESSMSQVSEELKKSEWVHLACHGIPNRKQPFDSAFELYDGRFTVERIMGCESENPEFAYLSACHTTIRGEPEESPDEVNYLATAMQFAGFRSVIGTMWAADDAETDKMTSKFYENMLDGCGRLDHTRAALALQMTVNSLAGIVPLNQRILYVHIGA